ncbi:AI-2E family transporter [Mariluticola halotolerans]|uniref:AI-2E family transporter n=1 Tax=Mariluticola halotolerans TaxID=2909283 RepID=UPI0026E17039|nr:AI-2E family transporter [Mariluticola halotolerans]UJQ95202.1 AI-2E family transporter [Mariluticola halotolerans]
MLLQNQIKVWLLLLAALILGLWVFRGILLPFVVGMALAYLLDPVADQLERWKFSRFWATSVILTLALVIFTGAFFLIVPLVAQQAVGLAQRLPGYVNQLQELANQWAPEVYAFLGAERFAQVQNALADLLQNGLGIAGNIFGQIMQSSMTLLNAIGLLVVTPVVAFYMLLDWDGMVTAADKLLPRKHRDEIRGVLKDIDVAMAGVIRGQVSVVLLLSVFYATSLTLTGLSFGLAIGLVAGLLSFIPYVGFLVGFVLSVGVALVQFWPEWPMIVAVFVVFLVGQFLEGNILYPKLVGSSIGVHPVWLMFALFAFGLIFGFVGLLLAVPMAAVASVLIRFAVRKYQESPLYLEADGSSGGQSPKAK